MSAAMIKTIEGETIRETPTLNANRGTLEAIYNDFVSLTSTPFILQKMLQAGPEFDASETIALADVLQLFMDKFNDCINRLDICIMNME